MNTAEATYDNPDHEADEPYLDPGERLSVAPDAVEVRRTAGLAALVGAAASAVAIAYLSRAVQTAAVLDWALFAVMGAFARDLPARLRRRPHPAVGRRRPGRPDPPRPHLAGTSVGCPSEVSKRPAADCCATDG